MLSLIGNCITLNRGYIVYNNYIMYHFVPDKLNECISIKNKHTILKKQIAQRT